MKRCYRGPSLLEIVWGVGWLLWLGWQLFLRWLLYVAGKPFIWKHVVRPLMFAFPDPETPHHLMIRCLSLIQPLSVLTGEAERKPDERSGRSDDPGSGLGDGGAGGADAGPVS